MVLEKLSEVHRPNLSTSSNSDLEISSGAGIDEKRLLQKLDLRLLPAVSILYLLSFLDRSNGTCRIIIILYS